jgi:hypothetical protein
LEATSKQWNDWQGREEEGYQKWDDLPRIGMSIENGCWNPTLNSKREEEEEFSRLISEKIVNIKFNQNPSNGSPIVSRGQTDRRSDMTKAIVSFRNFANAP